MYDYAPQACLIKDTDGKIYNIIDLWNGEKTPVDLSILKYSYAPRSCLVKNVDGTTVNIIDTILKIAKSEPLNEEIAIARGGYGTLGERLDKETKKIYDILSSLPYKGGVITVEHSKFGTTKDMQISGMTYQNFLVGGQSKIIKPNTTYTFIPEVVEGVTYNLQYLDATVIQSNISNNTTITISSDIKGGIKVVASDGQQHKNMLLEGDYTSKYIPPYFEGIKSVGEAEENKVIFLSKGKNLINENNFEDNTIYYMDSGRKGTDSKYKSFAIKIKPNKNYYLSVNPSNGTQVTLYKDNMRVNGYYNFSSQIINGNFDKITVSVLKNSFINIQLEQGTQATPYEPYITDRRELKLPFAGGLKGLPNGAKDLIYNKGDGCYVDKKVEKIILNGSESWNKGNTSTEVSSLFYTKLNNFKSNSVLKCDRFTYDDLTHYPDDTNNIAIFSDNNINIRILNNNLENNDIVSFKKWLTQNPVTVYYELATPVETKINTNDINLKTFNEVTYILSENTILPNLSFEAPCNVQEVMSTLSVRNITLQKEVDEKTTQLQEKDKQLEEVQSNQVAKDLDLDFRLFELEMNSQSPMKVNKGRNSTASTPYELMKYCIEHNLYDKLDMEYKINRYLAGNRITKEQSIELLELIK